MAEIVATAVAAEGARNCFTMIGYYISYTRKYKRNMDRLKDELKKIEATTITLSREVCIAKNNAEDIRPDVLGWLEKCEELKIKVNRLFETTRSFHVMSGLCCRCPNLKSRYLTSSEAAEMTSLIMQHLGEGNFDKVGQQLQLRQLPFLSPGEFHGFESRSVIVKEIMDCLKDESISLIGLCGMGGVGKTTLVKQIAEEVTNAKLFDEVAFAVVSQDVNVEAIQGQLASRLELKTIVHEKDTYRRAALLYKRLTDQEKKILIILDDIWQELDLRLVGIPVHGVCKGLKILLTSRYDSVCAYMKVQKRLQVGILSKDESWNLFKMTAEISDDTIPKVAEEVSQECAGLPLAIVTVGKSLRNKKDHAYRDVLLKLRDASRSTTSKIHNVLYSCIKSSYDFLESDEHRLLLLLCSLFPEDFEIQVQDLVRNARGLFDSLKSMVEARDRVETIIDDLVMCYLLLPGEKENCVKLHDVVRDTCLSIVSNSSDDLILSKFDNLGEMLYGLKFQKLQLLRLVDKEGFRKSGFFSVNVPEKKEMNFSNMQELRVLVVNHITTGIPSPLQFMINLQTLSLDYCTVQGDFTGIGHLKMLRVLSFFHSNIETFPTKVAQLTKLQCLDLRLNPFSLTPIKLPLGTLSNLNDLEELYLGDVFLSDIESLKEVCSLTKLHTVQFMVSDNSCLEVLLKNLDLSELVRFDIRHEDSFLRNINYQIEENILDYYEGPPHIDLYLLKKLMWRVESFHFDGKGIQNGVDVLGERIGFPKLTDLKLQNCDMKYLIIDAMDHLANGVLGKLETLEELIQRERPFGILEVNHGNLNVRYPIQCPLGNLKSLKICYCKKIKSLFPKSMVKHLGNLDQIYVESCPTFERVVTRQENEEEGCSPIYQFPTLRVLNLDRVRSFLSFGSCSGQMTCFDQVTLPKLERLFLKFSDSIKERGGEVEQQEVCSYLGSSLPKVHDMRIESCNNLFTIAKFGLVQGFRELKFLEVQCCSSIEVVFDFEEITNVTSAELPVSTTLLGRLEWLSLNTLPKLKHICRMLPNKTHVFANLKELIVIKCDSLRYLLTPATANMLLHLEKLWVKDNVLMEAIFGGGEIGMPNDGDEIVLGGTVLPKLESLIVANLPGFRKFCCCSPDMTRELPFLSRLEITFMMIDDILRKYHLPCLTSLTIDRIGAQRYPFSPSDEFLLSVRELILYDGDLMEAIIGSDKPERDDATKISIVFPELCKLVINKFPKIRNLCLSPHHSLELPSLFELCIIDCPIDILNGEALALQNLTELVVDSCGGNYKHLLSFSTIGVLVHLEKLVLNRNESMEAIFGDEKPDGEEIPNKTILFPKLRELEISYLPNLQMLCGSLNVVNVDLPSLTHLHIDGCPKMSKLCSGQLIAPHLKRVGYYEEYVDLETFTNSWLKDCESMTRCLDCSFSKDDGTCHHLGDKKSESKIITPTIE